MLLFWIFLLPLLYWTAAWAVGARERRRLHQLAPGVPPPGAAPAVTVVIPARDEEARIELCVRSVLGQNYPGLQVVAVDDGSTDRTPEILRSVATDYPNLRVVEAPPLPEGWVGKNHALWQGVQGVESEWLLFADADTVHHPDTLSAAMRLAQARGADAVTLIPYVPCPDFWTRAVNPLVAFLLAAFLLPTGEEDLRRRHALLNGQYLLIRRSVYERIGGHRRVRGRVVEDLAISEQLSLYKLHLAHGLAPELLTTNMYRGFGETWRGWFKGMYATFGGRPVPALAFAAFLLYTGTLPFAVLAAGTVYALTTLAGLTTGAEAGLAAIYGIASCGIACGLSVLARLEMYRLLRIPPAHALSLPLASALMAAMVVVAAAQGWGRKGATWKGRRYA